MICRERLTESEWQDQTGSRRKPAGSEGRLEMAKENQMIGGKYRIIRLIGYGGFGNVYLAEDLHLGRKAAVKEFIMQRDTQKSEMETMKSLGGGRSGLPEIYDWIYENGQTYLVMEYIEGVTLHEYLKENGRLDEKRSCIWGKEILDMLRFFHGQEPPFIYQDLKASNVIVCTNGHVRLVDFGSAFRMRYDGVRPQASGTKGYASPEQQSSMLKPCMQSDVYAWGRLMQEMLSGIDMSRDDSSGEQAAAVYGGEVSYGLVKIIRKCTSEKKEDRYGCADDVIMALEGRGHMNLRYNMYIAMLRISALIPAILAVIKGASDGVFSRLMKLSPEDMTAWKTVLMGEKKNLMIIAAMMMISYLLYENIGIRHFDRIRRVDGIYLTQRKGTCFRSASFLIIFAICLGISMRSQNADASGNLPVTVYDTDGHKVLIRDGAVYETEGDFIFSIRKPNDSPSLLTLSLTDTESGNAGTRTFYLDGSVK